MAGRGRIDDHQVVLGAVQNVLGLSALEAGLVFESPARS